MAFNLRAILTLEDRMSSRLRSISNSTSSLNRIIRTAGRNTDTLNTRFSRAGSSAGRFRGSLRNTTSSLTQMNIVINNVNNNMSRVTNNFNRVSRSSSIFTRGFGGLVGGIGSAVSSIFSLQSALVGLAGAYAAAQVGQKIFAATVGNAMRREQSYTTIGAAINDKATSEAYIKMMNEKAISSPVLDSQAMGEESLGLIAMIKGQNDGKMNNATASKAWDVIEKLQASNPMQGTDGATFALKELISGDVVSMVERFGILPKAFLHSIKKLPIDQMLAELDKYLNKVGMTPELIEEMGNTTAGKWQQIKEKWNFMMGDVGNPALKPLRDFFDKVLEILNSQDFTRYMEIGANIIKNVVTGLTNAAVGIYEWFNALVNSAEFQEQTTLYGKVMFIIEDIAKRFAAWFDSEGEAKLMDAGEKVLDVFLGVMDGSMDKIAPVAARVGSAFADGVISGIKQRIGESGVLSIFAGPQALQEWGREEKGIDASWSGIGSGLKETLTPKTKSGFVEPYIQETHTLGGGSTRSRNGGLGYVPYDGATYSLHKGEAILTRGENEARRKGANGSVSVGTINLYGVGGDIEGAADKLLDILANKIQLAGEGGA